MTYKDHFGLYWDNLVYFWIGRVQFSYSYQEEEQRIISPLPYPSDFLPSKNRVPSGVLW
jgi:hypothetical protein